MKKNIFVLFSILFVFNFSVFANDNMHIFPKDNGEIITGFKTTSLPEEVKITIAYPDTYKEQAGKNFPLVLLLDTTEYKIEDLRQMFFAVKKNNDKEKPLPIVASFRFNNLNLSQEQFDVFIEEIFAFFEVNYRAQSEPAKRVVLTKDFAALLALNSLEGDSNYFLNLGMILNNTTSLPSFDKPLKKNSRIFCFSVQDNILRLQNLLMDGGLKPMQNFFFKIQQEFSFAQFDLRYFFNQMPKVKQIKTTLPKEINQDIPFYLKVKTAFGNLDFFPEQEIRFAPPVLAYDETSGQLQVLLKENKKVKISGIFSGKKWSKTIKILN